MFNKNFIYKNRNEHSSYDLIDNSKLTVFIDSSLGYQSLSRGNKTFALSARSKYNNNPNFKFGWPAIKKNEGLFWINYFDEKKINFKLNNLYKMSHQEWNKKSQKLINSLIAHDPNNVIFKNYILKLLEKI